MANDYYMNKVTGELLTWEEMQKQFAEEYDGNDETNSIPYQEYYKKAYRIGIKSFISYE